MDEIKETVGKKEAKSKKIKPLKDFIIKQNDFMLELKEGESIEVPSKYLANLKTEKVIK